MNPHCPTVIHNAKHGWKDRQQMLHLRRMEDIDKLVINFDEGQLLLLNICLGFLMFGIALDLSLKDFKKVLQEPKGIMVGLTSQLILLPLFTLLLIYIMQPSFSIQLGMLLVASCPGGNVSNYMVHRAAGNTALSITMTSIVTLAAVVITPLSFWAWTNILNTPPDFATDISVNFLKMVKIIIQIIVIPLAIGMLISHRLPRIKDIIIKPIKIFSLLLLIGIIIFALIGNTNIIKSHLGSVFFLVLIHNGLAYVLGYQFARSFKLDIRDRRAISIETGIQNSGLGLILIFNYFAGLGGMALVAAWWGVWDIISGFLLANYWSHSKTK